MDFEVGRRNRALYAAPDDGRQEGLRMEGRMGLVASSAPWGWRRQDRKDGDIGRIGLEWLFIKLRLQDPAHRTKFLKLRYGCVFGIGVGVLESRFGVFVVEFRYIS